MTSTSSVANPSVSRPRGAWSAPAIDWLLTAMTPEVLCASLKEHLLWKSRFCKGGFKLTPQLLMQPAQLERLRHILLHTPARAEDIITLATPQIDLWKPMEEFLADFSERQIIRNWRLLLEAVPDQRLMILAMAMIAKKDSRLMTLAKRLLKTNLPWEMANVERRNINFWQDCAAIVQTYYELMEEEQDAAKTDKQAPEKKKNSEIMPRGKNAAREEQENQEKTQKWKKQFLEQKKQTQELQEELKNSRVEKKELDHLYREQKYLLSQAHEEWEQKKQQWQELKEQEILEVRQQFQQRLQEEMMAFKEELLSLKPGALSETEAICQANQTLLQQVEAAIADQQRLNEQYNTRSVLLTEYDHLDKMRNQISAMLADAMVTSDQLAEVLPIVDQRMHEISELLHVSKPAAKLMPGLPAQLTAMIKTAKAPTEDDNTFQCLEKFITHASELDLLSDADAVVLQDTIGARKKHWHQLASRTASVVFEQVPLVMSSFLPHQDAWKQVCLVIDGYNAIKCSEKWANIERKHGLNDARFNFLEACKRKKECFQEWIIVFDGVDPVHSHSETVAPGITMVFAAKKQEEQNADNYIVEFLEKHAAEKGKVWLVTGDLLLRRRAEKFCDKAASVKALEDFLQM